MAYSRINSEKNYLYDDKLWVISLVTINDSLSKQSKIIIEGLYDEKNSTEMTSFISDYTVNDEGSSKVKVFYVESAKYEFGSTI